MNSRQTLPPILPPSLHVLNECTSGADIASSNVVADLVLGHDGVNRAHLVDREAAANFANRILEVNAPERVRLP